MHNEINVDSQVVRWIIKAASNARDFRDYALASVLFALLATAYNHGKVDLSVVYESSDGTYPSQPADFSPEKLKSSFGADLVTFYVSGDEESRKGLTIPVPHLAGKALQNLLILASVRNRLVHKRKNKALEVLAAVTSCRAKNRKKSSSKKNKLPVSGDSRTTANTDAGAKVLLPPSEDPKRPHRIFIPYEDLHDLEELILVAREFRTYCEEIRISQILDFDGAPKAKIRAVCRYASILGFRTDSSNVLPNQFSSVFFVVCSMFYYSYFYTNPGSNCQKRSETGISICLSLREL